MVGYCYDCDDEVELHDNGVSWYCDACEGTDVDADVDDDFDDD